MENWLKTDNMQDAIISLEVVGHYLGRIDDNKHTWKWVIIGLHNALQGFMVLALLGSNPLNIMNDKEAHKWQEAYDHERSLPDYQLDSFLCLYKKIKSDRMLMYTTSKQFQPKGTQDRSVKKLNALRNDFIHFKPMTWTLQISVLPRITQDCLEVIEFLAFKCGNTFWACSPLETQTQELLTDAMKKIERIDAS